LRKLQLKRLRDWNLQPQCLNPSGKKMKQQGDSSPSKANNATIKVLNNSEEKEISTNKFKTAMTNIINEFKEEMYKQMNEIKEDTNKQLTELKKDSNKQKNEIKKTMQDMKEEFNKDIDILKKSNRNLGNEQLNTSNKNLNIKSG
jgi:ubiquitin C-terminal hydrolase